MKEKRRLLTYFLQTKLFKDWEKDVINNIDYWVKEDYQRSIRMTMAAARNEKGYSVSDWIYDVLDCVYKSELKDKVKQRLYSEIEELENYHVTNGTWDYMV